MGATIEATRAFRERFRAEEVPKFYSARLHVLFNFTLLAAVMLACLATLEGPKPLDFLAIPSAFVGGSFVVYVFHRYALHRPRPMAMAYRIHSQQHHVFYTDLAVTPEEPRDYYILFFPPWVVVAFVATGGPALFWGLRPIFGHDAAALYAATGTLYFALYEIVHFCSHLPDSSPILRIGYLRAMREHHRLHHRPEIMHKANFNIVLPLFDWLVGTYVRDTRPNS